MVACNFITFCSIAAFLVYSSLTQVEPSNSNSGHPETNSGRNEQTCLETDNIEEKVVKDIDENKQTCLETDNIEEKFVKDIDENKETFLETDNIEKKVVEDVVGNKQTSSETDNIEEKVVNYNEVENNCTKIVAEYSTNNKVEADDEFEKETNFSLAVTKAYMNALHNARNFHWNCLCGAFVPQFEFRKYFVLFENLNLLNNGMKDDLLFLRFEDTLAMGELLIKKLERIFIKFPEEIYSDICDNEHRVWKNSNAVWIEFSYYMMNIIENIHFMLHNYIMIEQTKKFDLKFKVFEYMSVLMSVLSNIESKGFQISETDVKIVRFHDKFMNLLYGPNKIEAKGDDSKNAVNTRKIVQCSFEVTLKFLQTLPSYSKDGNSCNDSVARVVKSLKTMKQATQNLHEIYRLNGSSRVLYEPSLEQEVTLDLENIVHICAQFENEKKIRNITNISENFSTTVKLISDIASDIVEFPKITPESEITTFILSGATKKVYEYFLDFILGTAKDETIVQRLQNLSNSVTGFRNTEPLKPEDKKETILIPSRIFEMFKSKDSQMNIQSVINTARTVTKVSVILIDVIILPKNLDDSSSSESFTTLFEKVRLLTEVSNDLLELFKNDPSLVYMYEKMVVKKFSEVYECICANINGNYFGRFERKMHYKVLNGARIINDISVQILEMLEGLSRTYDEFTVVKIKRSVIFLSNAAEKLFSLVKLLDPNKPASPEEIEKETIWFRERVPYFMHPYTMQLLDIRMQVGQEALNASRKIANFSKELDLKLLRSSSSGKLETLSSSIVQLKSLNYILLKFKITLETTGLFSVREKLKKADNDYNYDKEQDHSTNIDPINDEEISIPNNQTLEDFSGQIVKALSIIESLIYKMNGNVKSYMEADDALSFDAFLISIVRYITTDLIKQLESVKDSRFKWLELDINYFELISTRMQNLANTYGNQ